MKQQVARQMNTHCTMGQGLLKAKNNRLRYCRVRFISREKTIVENHLLTLLLTSKMSESVDRVNNEEQK